MFSSAPISFVQADAIEAAISIAVIVIAFIGWIVQLAGGSKNASKPVQQPQPRPKAREKNKDGLQNEIDAFLQEVSDGDRAGGKRREPVAAGGESSTASRRPAAFDRPRPKKRTTPPEPAVTAVAVEEEAVPRRLSNWDREQQRRRERLVSNISDRHLETTPLGREIQEHVEKTMAESRQLRAEKEEMSQRLAEAKAEIRSLQSKPVKATRGSGSETMIGDAGGSIAEMVFPEGQTVEAVNPFAAMLKDPQTLRAAVIAGEIFGRPKSLTRR